MDYEFLWSCPARCNEAEAGCWPVEDNLPARAVRFMTAPAPALTRVCCNRSSAYGDAWKEVGETRVGRERREMEGGEG